MTRCFPSVAVLELLRSLQRVCCLHRYSLLRCDTWLDLVFPCLHCFLIFYPPRKLQSDLQLYRVWPKSANIEKCNRTLFWQLLCACPLDLKWKWRAMCLDWLRQDSNHGTRFFFANFEKTDGIIFETNTDWLPVLKLQTWHVSLPFCTNARRFFVPGEFTGYLPSGWTHCATVPSYLWGEVRLAQPGFLQAVFVFVDQEVVVFHSLAHLDFFCSFPTFRLTSFISCHVVLVSHVCSGRVWSYLQVHEVAFTPIELGHNKPVCSLSTFIPPKTKKCTV